MSDTSEPNASSPSRRPQGSSGQTTAFIPFEKQDIEQSIPARFEQQVRRYPDRLAVTTSSRQLTYASLNRTANRVAQAVLARGAEGQVALLMEHDAPLIAAILAVLKTGKTYVALDPAYPWARTRYILEDSQASLILTNNRNLASASKLAHSGCPLLNIDELDADFSVENPGLSIPPDTPAYIIYTSGSTGQPKGVVHSHRGVLHFIMNSTNIIRVCPDDRVTLFYSCSVAASVMDVFMSLLNGAVLCPFDLKEEGVGRAADWMVREEITVFHSNPTVFRHFVRTMTGEETFPKLRLVFISGEPLYKRDVELHRKYISPDCPFANLLGSSETLAIRWFPVDKHTPITSNLVPVGYPIDDVEVLLLDDDGREIGFNRVGEVAVKSRYLSTGYWGKPDLTRTAFRPAPTDRKEGVYHTGDLGLMRPDGCLMHLGRKDYQVKIRGYRIEPAEIEMALLDSGNVKEAVIVAQQDEHGDQRLAAYWVPTGEPAHETPAGKLPVAPCKPMAGDLRDALAETLPDYMVPAVFVMLDALPLTANGKVDRRALPAPGAIRPELAASFVAPRTAVEGVLAGIWAEVLRVDRVGVHDNFFELGGHSLLATRLISRMNDAFRLELPLRALFDAPTISGMVVALEQRGVALDRGRIIRPCNRKGNLPLSFAQQRLWFLDRLEPGKATYNIPVAFRLVGALDMSLLERCLSELVARHESLRTVFTATEGRPTQVIQPPKPVVLRFEDLRALLETDREATCNRLLAQEARKPFDLSRGPLFRALVLRRDEEDHVLLLTMHHIVSDGWSMGVLVRELSELYEAHCAGRSASLPELPIQYADFACWQRQSFQGEALAPQLAYWKDRLGGELPVLEMPTDRSRPRVHAARGAVELGVIPSSLMEALAALSRREGVTLFMTLLAAFQTLLHRFSGQDDIVVGSPIANRNRNEIEGLVGFFVNTLAMRMDLSGDPSFQALLGRAREVALGAYAHQDLPFERLVEELQPPRDMSRNPLFQVLFALQNVPPIELSLPGVTAHLTRIHTHAAKLDLAVVLREKEQELVGEWEYDTDLFDATTIARMVEHFQTLLRGIVAHPEWRVSELPLLADTERHRLLVEWNATDTEYPKEVCVHELFEAQVERAPDAVAVVFGDEALSYSELNRRANRLAHHLQSVGVGPEARVGLCLERSVELIVGILGILKAGGAYVPLDPEYPQQRLAFMLKDIQAQVVVTQARCVDQLPETRAALVCLNTDAERIAQQPETNPTSDTTPGSLAYTIYTSGSTGTPKGVLVEHRGLCNLSEGQRRIFGATPESRHLQFASASFDASIFEILMALQTGGRLFLGTGDALLPGPALFQFLREHQITHASLPPSTLSVMPDKELPALEVLIVAGEVCPADLVKRWAKGRRFFNGYGPTEATVCTTLAECSGTGTNPPIGRPFVNTQVYLLDSHLQPVPIGVAGELHIGGVGLARGYHDRPVLTDEKFISNPFSDEPGARLFRTGDLARYLPDGNIEFLGRIDDQVKVRGFRIELGEIETVLGQHPAARESVVLAREDMPGDKRLVAYVVADGEPASLIPELRRLLGEQLPEYMVPSAFVLLDTMPLTPSGKVDRRALPAPKGTRPVLEEAYVPPRDPVEEVLAAVWMDVLHIERVGVHDHFFEMGGHSLLATQVISRVQSILQVEVPLRTLFESPTVAGLALALVEHERTPGRVAAIARIRRQIDTMQADEVQALLKAKNRPVDGE